MTFNEWIKEIEPQCRKDSQPLYTTQKGFEDQRKACYLEHNLIGGDPFYRIFYMTQNDDRITMNIERFFYDTDEHLPYEIYAQQYKRIQ